MRTGAQTIWDALRVIPGSAKSQRVEYRVAAADANPYVILAAALASGLWGIENRIEPEPLPRHLRARLAQDERLGEPDAVRRIGVADFDADHREPVPRQQAGADLDVVDEEGREFPGLVTFRAEKTFPVFNTHRLAVRVNLYNALNASTATVLEQRAGSDFLRPRAILPPRIAEISASYTF